MTRPFPGWIVVAAVFIQLMTSSGLAFYGLAIYLDALTDEQAFSTTSVSLATSMFFIVSGLVGQLVAQHGSQRRGEDPVSVAVVLAQQERLLANDAP